MSIEALNWALRQRTGSVGRKAVLLTLADLADEKWSCWPSQARLAEVTEQGVRTVRRQLAELESAGFLRRSSRFRDDGKRTSDRYFLTGKPAANLAGSTDPPPAIQIPETGIPVADNPSEDPLARDKSPYALSVVREQASDEELRRLGVQEARRLRDQLTKGKTA